MSGTPNLEHLALLKFGLAVPPQQRDEVVKMIKANPAYKQDFENIKNTIKTMCNEDQFLNCLYNSHIKIAEVGQNNKFIQQRQHTFHFKIRAINAEHIPSLTERAFFNSFNLQRIVLNDLQEQMIYLKGEDQRKKDLNKRIQEKSLIQLPKEIKKPVNNGGQNEEEEKCICGKVIQQSYWVECSKSDKCRGSGWYHLECAGIKAKPDEIQNIEFICDYCKRSDDKDSSSSNKKFKSNFNQ